MSEPRRAHHGRGGDQPAGDPEVVLSQTLRALAGGPRPHAPRSATPAPAPARALTLLQWCLVFVLLGLTVGVVAGLLTLVL